MKTLSALLMIALSASLWGQVGAPGPPGPTGAQGPQGNQGATGAAGPTGPTGATGAQGAQGIQGATGAQGSQGTAGSNGTNGTVIPTGMISFIASGTCPAGWTELSTMVGRYIMGTTAANGGVGTTGGSTSYTPAGSATVSSLTAAAQTFTGGATTVPALGVGTLAAPAHTHTITQSSITTTKFTTNASGTAAYTGGGVVTTPSGSASSTTITGSTATGSLTPLGGNSASAVTGTLAFAGTPATIQPPYIELIPCSKN